MGRAKRIWSPEHFHHVTSRGNWRDYLFRGNRDFMYFLRLLSYIHRNHAIEITSYCLMSNHYHLLLRSKEASLSSIMSRINKSYSDYYNYRYKVTGHLFEKRFFSKPIYDDLGIAEVSRYIHLNPLEASIVEDPQDYPWSSYYFFHNSSSSSPPFLNFQPLLNFFPGQTEEQRKMEYHNWVQHKLKNPYR
ncbi:transposase [Bacillus sp. 31A1R]|uniref:Transposase n=1 Tax=Robertmurraya mangrovi TaxID=3098077 RepID=A0ABU5IXF7_9BACI|nr:transposase [Bacillus sp. 31A1R]MDZ5471858.1 transposase [Bacillus sp. 31A1R]